MPNSIVSRYIVVFLDDIFSMEYFGLKLPPYWRYTYQNSPAALVHAAMKDYKSLLAECQSLDEMVAAASDSVGGLQYAYLTSLTYRQVGWL